MTKLERPVRRVTEARSHRGRRLVVELAAPGSVRIREEGARSWLELPLRAVYEFACRVTGGRK